MIRFDEVTHTYFMGDEIWPSVTQILSFGKKQFYKNNGSADRGTRVHEATAIIDTLGGSLLDLEEDIFGFCKAWANFTETSGARVKKVEAVVYHDALKYAGTMDRLIDLNGLKIADIKTGAPASWHGAQLAGYALAHEAMGLPTGDGGVVVYLKENGRFSLRSYQGPSWDQCKTQFLQALKEYKESIHE